MSISSTPFRVVVMGVLLTITGCVQKPTVSLESLLYEMVDRDRLARYPAPEYRLKQASSYERASVTPDDPEGWFANVDRGHFIRTEMNDGREEWVLMEHEGPGAMARIWMPDPRITPGVLRGRQEVPANLGSLRIYLDGNSEPTIEGSTYDLLNGTLLASYPFGHKSLSSAVSFLPFPWEESVKITMDIEPQYYIFTYRAYPEGTKVTSFQMEDLEAAADVITRVGNLLVNPDVTETASHLIAIVAPNAEESVDLPFGAHAIRTVTVKLDSYDNPQVTRSLILNIEFDDEETTWCPVGDFFGTGVGLHPFEGWYRTVASDGTMSSRWVMPYQKSARISLLNLYHEPIEVELKVAVSEWEWDDRSMYFHSNWRHESDIPTLPRSDWNYVTIEGQGVYVGDALTVWNPNEIWWGEGDAKIWVDGESFPSIFGTGTEDYYAYSYGGQNRAFYEHPFHAQVRVMEFDKNYPEPVPIVRVTQGYSTETRTRAIDAMPFGASLKLDMEIWHWEECLMNYNVATYWYGKPGTTSNVQPMPDWARRRVETIPVE